jgi:hypothetical protein
MSLKLLLTTALTSLLTAPALSSVILRNSGTLSGWDSILKEHDGTVDQVTNVVYAGSTAIKVTQTYDSSGTYTGRYHSEVHSSRGYQRGEELFYGFAFRLSSDWEFDSGQSYNIGQWIADFSNTGCDDWKPSSMIWLDGNTLNTRTVSGDICNSPPTATYSNIATVSAGVWHTIVVQANWQSDDTGYYKLWFDGDRVLAEFGIPTTLDDDRQFEWHMGLYANSWHDQSRMLGNQPFRQVWYDNLAIGTTYADVDPTKWS